jgi:hypothetical protein
MSNGFLDGFHGHTLTITWAEAGCKSKLQRRPQRVNSNA